VTLSQELETLARSREAHGATQKELDTLRRAADALKTLEVAPKKENAHA
jgi:hypothetical protein